MKIAIVTAGVLPVPALKGGAVETLIDFLIEYNEMYLKNQITIYGIDDAMLAQYDYTKYKRTNFHLINQNSIVYKVKRKFFDLFNSTFYYNSLLDYLIKQVAKRIKKESFDVIIVENRPGFVCPLSLVSQSKIVLHLHNDTFDQTTKDAIGILNVCDAIFTVSDYVKRRVETVATTHKVSVLYNGIDVNRFMFPDSMLDRTSLGLSVTDFVVVYTGRIEPIKGIKELLEAFVLLNDYKEIKLLIVGGSFNGSTDEDEFMLEMRELSQSISGQVVFTGFQPYHKVPSILHLCDLAVIPSVCEDALTMTSLEDMAAGLPLVVTRSGGIPEAVDPECALIVDKEINLPENLSKAILSLYQDKTKLQQMSQHSKERALLFTKEQYASSFFEKIQQLF